HDARALHRGGRVGEVVRDGLVLIERGNRDLAVLSCELGEAAGGGVDDRARPIDGCGRGAQLVTHGGEVTDPRPPRPSASTLTASGAATSSWSSAVPASSSSAPGWWLSARAWWSAPSWCRPARRSWT